MVWTKLEVLKVSVAAVAVEAQMQRVLQTALELMARRNSDEAGGSAVEQTAPMLLLLKDPTVDKDSEDTLAGRHLYLESRPDTARSAFDAAYP